MTSTEAREKAVLAAVRERREVVNEAIPEELPVQKPERLYEASRYLLDAGGKRLRPTILLTTAEALADVEPLSEPYRAFPTLEERGYGRTNDTAHVPETIDVMDAAVSVEVIQSFTLIHDDIMDDDDLRRGVPAVHKAYDLETAILAGDTLYSKAFEIMLETGAPSSRTVEALEVLATTCTKICEGQALDVTFEERDDVTPEEYLEMVEQKTAVLYAAAACLPAILLGADDETVDALYGYGLDIGRAFQIHDDVLDLTVPSEKLGKQRGSDLVENKQTLITVHARDQGVDVESLVDTDDVEAVTEAEIDEAVAELEAAGSIEYANEMARDLVEQGKDRLEVLPENEAHELLAELADYLIERSY
ncbi:geranylfarnesyl diphosphate synthase [Natrarchaeobaculum sulfurireducens]|uniref:(2E,6E)-farnesyl diphosphate synthase / Geranylgeranyl diphosphate synthase n=1 Tax=Natrarchaeobaculum sulfurireducens TaxID=2044521 RepID=A0A346PSM6_9EURY|nr:polyprenyl synthetase family protein [Natrarchaeobaculum sulfurireducens]AXR77536.1 Geranylgeranyl pyrophosphate synthase [Natrarchaeobaculum sulfurireducens]AXR82521.1 (2E,6E)-farnesyl diphosphate synthase / Geranylgeranyl diphosphate synthase [Natrarchaeobaculum sulfurireducens]